MFPLPVRLMMQFKSIAPVVQRLMSAMMSWMMFEEDTKVPAGAVLKDINKVRALCTCLVRLVFTPGHVITVLRWTEALSRASTTFPFVMNWWILCLVGGTLGQLTTGPLRLPLPCSFLPYLLGYVR